MVKTTDFTMSRRRQRASLPSLLLLTFSRLCCHLPRGGAAMFPPPSQQPLGANRNISKRRRSKSSLSHLVRSSPRGRRRRLKVEANVLREPDGFDIVGSPTLFDAKKDLKICSILGALDLTRLSSYLARSILSLAVEDAEMLRESWTEGMANDGLRGGLSDLNDMASTLRWRERNEHAARQNFSDWTNLTADDTTETAGLGYTDDRVGRRVERYVSVTVGVPFVGTKETDMAMVDVTSNVLPWIVDRRANESMRFMDHQSDGRGDGGVVPGMQDVAEESTAAAGRGTGTFGADAPTFNMLYEDAWAATWGNALVYYPPILTSDFGAIGDSLGEDFDLWAYLGTFAPRGWPLGHQVPPGGSIRDTIISLPLYKVGLTDSIVAILSAAAPVYYTGQFRGFTYNDTFVGAVGIDVNTNEIAWVFDGLDNGLCDGSFALLVTAGSFDIVSISQKVVDRIYPERTGMEEDRVVKWNDNKTGETIVEDRRNETYEPRDTIFQGLLDGLESSNDWTKLHQAVMSTPPGGRDQITMNLVLTGTTEPQKYYVLYERWASVSDFVMLVFAPTEGVDNAIRPVLSESDVNLEVMRGGTETTKVTLTNNGTLDFVANIAKSGMGMPDWIALVDADAWTDGVTLSAGQSVDIEFVVQTGALNLGIATGPIALDVVDDGYRDCIHNSSMTIRVSVRVTTEPNLNHLDATVRAVGLLMCATVLVTAVVFAAWVIRFRNVRVVRASQPLFLIMICFGCFVMGCTIIPLSIDDGVASVALCNVSCMATPWLFSMGFVLTFAALFSKIWRINKIFHQSNYRKITVTEMDVIVPFALLFTFNFIFLLCWTLLDPRVWTRVPVGEWESYGTCTANGTIHILMYSLIGAVDIAALVLACVQAYRARDIGDEYSESKYIGMALGGMLQVALLGIPLMFIVTENKTADFFIKSALTFIVSKSALLLIFVPKMVHMRNKKRDDAKKKADALARAMQNATAGLPSTPSKKESLSQQSTGLVESSILDSATPGLLITHILTRRRISEKISKEEFEEVKCQNERLKEQIAQLRALLRQKDTDCDDELQEVGLCDNVVALQADTEVFVESPLAESNDGDRTKEHVKKTPL